MQSTFIKIKFTPLIRQLQKDNIKCCLEIMPNVSCVENLDKIEWDAENNVVEYNVPVTYKIILKRSTEEENKIYYSCIDLRHFSTSSTLACGDVTRVISDNFILSKVITNFDNSIVLTEPNYNVIKIIDNKTPSYIDALESIEENVVKSVSLIENINEACLKTSKKGDKNLIKDDIETYSNQEYIDFIKNNIPAKQIFIENTMSKETITEMSEIKNNKKLKLTVTSICTFSTTEAASSEMGYKENTNNNNSKICPKFNQTNRHDYKNNQLTELFPVNTFLCNEYNRNKNSNSKRKSFERILPNLRVAHFMRTVENEILPLKILLNEIYKKCASLGLVWKSDMLQKPHNCEYPKCTDKKDICDNKQRGSHCNRVVYSIVFEE